MREVEESRGHLCWLPATLLAVVAAAVALESRRLGVGEASRPGAGFFPFWLSVSLTAVALLLSCGVGRQSRTESESANPAGMRDARNAFLLLALYCALLIPLGFIAATFLFFSTQARIIERLAWRRAALRGAVATAAAYGLFFLLDVQLPAGLWLE